MITKGWKLILYVGSLLATSCSTSFSHGQPARPPDQQSQAYPSPAPQYSADGRLKLFIPRDAWVETFFPEINARAQKSGLSDLRTTVLPADDIEVRIWGINAFFPPHGFVLKRQANKWKAWSLRPMLEGEAVAPATNFPEPAIGWDEFWKNLVNVGILDLPDADDIGCNADVTDCGGYIVEVNVTRSYRIYFYYCPEYITYRWNDRPDLQKCDEALKIQQIARLVFP